MINLLHGDCLELMKDIPDNSIDMVLCDPPYGTTACKWDTVIDFELMWSELKRITKDKLVCNGIIEIDVGGTVTILRWDKLTEQFFITNI